MERDGHRFHMLAYGHLSPFNSTVRVISTHPPTYRPAPPTKGSNT